MKIELDEFVAFLRSRIKPAIPVDVLSKTSAFAPFWRNFVSFVSAHVERAVGSNVADTHNSLVHHIPSIAIVPRRDVFIVFIKKNDYDDVYLAYNTAATAVQSNVYFYVVPYIESSAIDAVVANRINPAILIDLLYILPLLSSIPCTSLVDELPFIKDYLTIKMQSYITSDDVGLILLGYTLLKLLSMPVNNSYEKVFDAVKSLVLKQLEKRGLYVVDREIVVEYVDFSVRLNIVLIKSVS